jgi:periplasmic protein TonB
MKTKFFEVLQTDTLDEIIFENRNKEYGSYEIRKKKDESLLKALLTSLSLLLLFALSAKFATLLMPEPNSDDIVDIEATFTDVNLNDPVVPKMPELEIPKSLEVKNIGGPPVVVSETDITPDMALPTMEDLLDQQGTGDIAPENLNFDPAGTDPVLEEIIYDPVNVQLMPKFKGDFQKWFFNHISYSSDAVGYNIQGTVVVEFIIDNLGKVTQIKVLRGVHPALDQSVINTLSSCPDWKPGMQNGYPVKVRYIMPVKFKIDIY